MKTQKLKLFILTFSTVFLGSCTKLLYTSLDVLRPAEVTFAPTANRLLIVNNTVIQPSDIGHRSQKINEKPKVVLLRNDSLALFCLGALTEELESRNFFSTVQLASKSVNPSFNFQTIKPLDSTMVVDLCRSSNANVILSLDKIKVSDDITEYFLNESSEYLNVFEVRYESTWSIHYPNKVQASTIQFKDTIFWDAQSYYRQNALNMLPRRTDGIIDGALNVGKKSINRFLPYWTKADRYFYMYSNKYLKKGMDSIYVKNWKSAINLWDKASRSRNTLVQAYAANNIAVAYEILGEIDKAIESAANAYYLLGKSASTDGNAFFNLYSYIQELSTRKKEILLLKKQVGQ